MTIKEDCQPEVYVRPTWQETSDALDALAAEVRSENTVPTTAEIDPSGKATSGVPVQTVDPMEAARLLNLAAAIEARQANDPFHKQKREWKRIDALRKADANEHYNEQRREQYAAEADKVGRTVRAYNPASPESRRVQNTSAQQRRRANLTEEQKAEIRRKDRERKAKIK